MGHDEEHEEEGELDLATLKEHEEATKVKNIDGVVIGRWQMETWYFSPFGKEYDGTDTLYFASSTSFFARKEQLDRYLQQVQDLPPAGRRDLPAEDGEAPGVDIRGGPARPADLLREPLPPREALPRPQDPVLRCGALFVLHHLRGRRRGAHMVGYFSKEKHSSEEYNLACISAAVLPA